MANILIAWQDEFPDRLGRVAAAVARGAATVTTARVCRVPLEGAGLDRLHWCDGFALGVQSDSQRLAETLDRWRQSLEADLWEAVQGKFATVFVAAPQEVGKRADARDCAERLLAAHGMLVTGFCADSVVIPAGVEPLERDPLAMYGRMGRLLSGMVHAWIHESGNPGRKRVLGSLVRATRRVPAMRPGPVGADRAPRHHDASDVTGDMVPNA